MVEGLNRRTSFIGYTDPPAETDDGQGPDRGLTVSGMRTSPRYVDMYVIDDALPGMYQVGGQVSPLGQNRHSAMR